MAHLWKRLFRKKDHLTLAVETAIEEQARFERDHGIPYAPDQRAIALTQRFIRLYGTTRIPKEAVELLNDAATSEWGQAVTAAESDGTETA